MLEEHEEDVDDDLEVREQSADEDYFQRYIVIIPVIIIILL